VSDKPTDSCNPQQQLACQAQFGRVAATLELVRDDVKEIRQAVNRQAARVTEVQVMLREHINDTPTPAGRRAWAAILTTAAAIGTAIGAAWRGTNGK
jgi:hypothetical protein